MAPRCGQSLGDGPAASELGVGARWPVSRRCAVERCAASSWFIDRTIASRCACWASSGKCSLIEIPGTLVAIGRNGPRISSGASGLGSQVSSWLGPPHRKIRMHDFARPNPFGPESFADLLRPQQARQTRGPSATARRIRNVRAARAEAGGNRLQPVNRPATLKSHRR